VVMTKSEPLKKVANVLAKYYPPMTYRKALQFAHLDEDFPVWPRVRNEHFQVKVQELKPFCQKIGLSDNAITAFLRELGVET